MRPPSHQPRPHPPTATSFRHSCAPLRHSCAPLRHSCAGRNPCDHHRINHARTFRRPPRSVIPTPPPSLLRPPPSFLRRQESMRPPSHQPRPHLPTATPLRHSCAPSITPAPPSVIPAQAGIHATTIASTAPAPSDRHPDPSFPRPLRHSCAGRNPCDHHRINRARTFRRPPRSVTPAPPSVIPASPSVIPAQAGIHATTIPSTTPAPSDRHHDPSFLRPLHHSCAPLRHSCAPLRHSCAGRNPCDHHRINRARTFRRPSDPSIAALPPRCSGRRRPSSTAPPRGGSCRSLPLRRQGAEGGGLPHRSATLPPT